MSLANLLENNVLDAMLGVGATLLDTVLEIGLSLTMPDDDGTNITEPSGGGYARVSVDNNNVNWGDAVYGTKTNATDIIFPEATENWGTLLYWVLYSMGTPSIIGTIDDGAGVPTPLVVVTGNKIRFTPGSLRIMLD
jgi:hypothetical protein